MDGEVHRLIKEVIAESANEKQLQAEIRLLQKTEYPIILFGAGCTSEFIVEQMQQAGIYPRYFCDNNQKKVGRRIAGIEVISPERALENKKSYFYITTQLFYREIKKQLMSLEIDEDRIMKCDLIYQFAWEKQVIPYFESNMDILQEFYDRLQDDKSKLVFENRMKFLITRNREYMTSIHDDIQYFDKEIFEPESIKNYIDIGAYIGDTILQFCKLNKSYQNIWGFEPDKALYQAASKNLDSYKRITLVPSATSDFEGKIQVESSLGKMQTIDNQYEGESLNNQMFDVCRLDNYFSDCNLDSCFVKMDIEGAELATLRGMKEFIRRNKPTLAVCIYHKLEDIIEIPQLLDSFGGGYKYYLRHYSDNQTETVLFAKAGEIKNG